MTRGWKFAPMAVVSAVAFTLLPGGVAAAASATNLSATTVNGQPHTIRLVWSNPDSEPVVVEMATGTYPATASDGDRVYSGTGTRAVVDDVLSYRTTYYFSMFTDAGGSYVADGQASATTPRRPVGGPTLSNGSDWRRAKIAVSFSRTCRTDGCFRVSWSVGSQAFPKTPFTQSHQAVLGSTSPQTFAVGHDLTSYNVSLWQVGPGSTYGAPVHRRIRLPEWLPGLRTGAVDVTDIGAHRLNIDWWSPRYDSRALRQIRLYQSASRTAPGTPTALPKSSPIWTCAWPCSRHRIQLDHLRTLTPYTFSMYGADAHGHVRRVVTKTEFPRAEGFYEGAELIDHDQTEAHSTVRDRRDRTHLVSGRSGVLRYVVRASGSSTWVRHDVPGLSSASEYYDQTVLGLSQSGNRVYLATYCVYGTGHPASNIYLTSKPADGEFGSPVTVAATGGYCGGGDYEGEPKPELGDVTGNAENEPVLAYSTCDEEPAPGVNCSTDVVRQLPDQSIETTPVVSGTNWFPANRPRIAVSENDDYVLVQSGTLNGQGGVYAWTKDAGASTWSAPTQLADGFVDGVVVSNGQMWALVTRLDAGADSGLYLLRRPVGGSWHGPTRVAHTDAHDAAPLTWPTVWRPPISAALALNRSTGVLDVLFTRVFPRTQRGGLRHLRRRADGTWTQPHALTTWWKDVPADLMLTSTGAIRYSYRRY